MPTARNALPYITGDDSCDLVMCGYHDCMDCDFFGGLLTFVAYGCRSSGANDAVVSGSVMVDMNGNGYAGVLLINDDGTTDGESSRKRDIAEEMAAQPFSKPN